MLHGVFVLEGSDSISGHRVQKKLKHLSFLLRRKKQAERSKRKPNKNRIDFLFFFFFSHWKDTFNVPKRTDETIFVHVCAGGLDQYLLEVRKRILLFLLSFYWSTFAYSGFSCNSSDTFVPCQNLRRDMGLLRGLFPTGSPPFLNTLCTARRPKQGSTRVKWVEIWKTVVQLSVELSSHCLWANCKVLSHLLHARPPGWSQWLDWASPHPICVLSSLPTITLRQ